jgi:hypothetical protein
MEVPGEPTELTRSFLSYRMLKEVLETSNIKDDEEVRAGRHGIPRWVPSNDANSFLCRPSW